MSEAMKFSSTIMLLTLAGLFLPPAYAAMSEGDSKNWDDSLRHARELRDEKQYNQAEKVFLELQSQAENSDDKKRVRKALTALAAVYFYRKDYAKAEELDRKALGLAESLATDNDGSVAICLNDLAETLVEEKRFDEALPIIKRSVALSEVVFSHNHPLLGMRLNFLADLLEKTGHKEEAIQYRSEGQGIIDAFLSQMSRKIKGAWKPPRSQYSYSSNVAFLVTDHGYVRDVHILDSSKNATNDQAAVDAVIAAQPFADIDSKADDDQLNLTFKFDYNFHQQGDAGRDVKQQTAEATSETVADSQEKINAANKQLAKIMQDIDEIKKDKKHTTTTLAEFYGRMSDTLMVLGQHNKAIEALKEALASPDFSDRNAPGTLMVMSELGCVYSKSMKSGLAETTLKAVVDSPNFEQILDVQLKQQALDDLGHSLSNLGHYAEAQKYYSRKKGSD